MHKHSDTVLIVACVVVGFVLLSAHHSYPGLAPAGWAGAGRGTVSAGFVAHMAELHIRRLAAAVGAVVCLR